MQNLHNSVSFDPQSIMAVSIASRFQDYAYLGCCVAGYPELDVRAADYWERFWRVHNYLVSPAGPAA